MLVEYKKDFLKKISKIDTKKEQIKKQVEKIVKSPEAGKPMRYSRKGTREVYITPYRLAYSYNKEEEKLIFLGIYHKNQQ